MPLTKLKKTIADHPVANDKGLNDKIRLVLGNISGKKLIQDFSCPLYIFNLDILKQSYVNLRTILDDAGLKNLKIHYAVKANHNLAVINTLGNLGCGADVVSIGEFFRTVSAGIQSKSIIFSGLGKTEDELKQAIENKVGRINIESIEEWHDILNLQYKSIPEISIRFNLDVDAKTHPHLTTAKKDSKFGLSKDEIIKLFSEKSNQTSAITGIAIHIGSQITDISVYKKAFDLINQLLIELKQQFNWQPKHLDLGGGFSVAYSSNNKTINLQDYARLVAESFLGKNIQLAIEPGRSLVAESGILISKVIRIKKTSTNNYAIIDAGMNNFIRHILYKENHPIITEKEEESSLPNIKTVVVGPICESADVFVNDCYLPRLSVGDLIIIGKTGAYGAVMASAYNARSFIPEVVIKNKQAYLSVPEVSSSELLKKEEAQFSKILKYIN